MRAFFPPLVLPFLSTALHAAEIHVATGGADANPGTAAAPLATFAAAQAKARGFARTEPVRVVFHGGTYYLGETVRFTPADSGTAAFPVSYEAAAEDGEVVLSGGDRLTGLAWTPYRDGIFKATVPAGLVADQLFVNDAQQPLARYPDYDPAVTIYHGYAADAISPERAARWANPAGGYLHALHGGRWGGFHYRITGKDAANKITYEGGRQNNRASAPHPTYRFVENILEELTGAGEWFYQGETHTLYFQPPAGLDLKSATFETAGRLKHLIDFRGTAAAPVEYVTLKGFTFRHAARTFMETDEPLLRSDWTIYRGAAVFLEGARHCTLAGCDFDRLGGNALFFSGYNRDHTVTGSRFHELGASAVCFVGHPDAVRDPLFNYDSPANSYAAIDRVNSGPKSGNYPADCTVGDCLIEGIGTVEKQAAGVQISMASRITVRHCSIYDCSRAGINIGDGCWGGHLIEYCDVFDTVRETSDHGSFNSWGRDRYWNLAGASDAQLKEISMLDACQTTVLRNSRWQCHHGWDIDLDDGSSNYRIENNLLLKGGLKWREGFNRVGRNNVILASSLHPHVWYPDSGDVFERNIVSAAYQPAAMSGSLSRWGQSLDFNFFPTERDRDAWRAKGCDAHSAFGDPRYLDPAAGDYRVAADSPALALGFENFPMDRFGVTRRPFVVHGESVPVRTPAGIAAPPAPAGIDARFSWLGAGIKSVTRTEESSAFGTDAAQGGVFFIDRYAGSAAALTGLQESDLIVSIDGVAVRTVVEMVAALSTAKGEVTFGVVRRQAPARVTVAASRLAGAGRLVLESGTLDLGTDFVLAAGATLVLQGDSKLLVRGSFTNEGTLDVREWRGGLPASLVNRGQILRAEAGR